MSNSNRDQINALLDAWVNSIDLTDRTSQVGRQMADAVLDVMADGIHQRCIDKQAEPNGTAWAENAASYTKRKDKAGKPVGVLTGEMLGDMEAFKGTRTYEPDKAEMEYGKSEAARKKAEWFTRGSKENPPDEIEYSGAKNQPSRPFYDLDDEIKSKAFEKAQEHYNAHVAAFNGGMI